MRGSPSSSCSSCPNGTRLRLLLQRSQESSRESQVLLIAHSNDLRATGSRVWGLGSSVWGLGTLVLVAKRRGEEDGGHLARGAPGPP
eukprot:45081-Rhodomonas_salina.1